MLLEVYDINVEVRTLHLLGGLVLGLLFGIAAQVSRFCLRRAIAGPQAERASAGAVWLTALSTAIAATGVAAAFGLVDLSDHRLLSTSLPILAIVLGGLFFGTGMVLTRGCVSRLTVLSGSGNLRALVVLMVFVITAHATLKGVLAPIRTSIGAITLDAPFTSVTTSSFGIATLLVAVAFPAYLLARRSRPAIGNLLLAAIIGLVAVAGWMMTSVLLFDEFDPLPVQSAAFTLPWSDTLFWVIASTAVPAGFGVGFVAGVLTGSFASAVVRSEFKLESFDGPAQTIRYIAGGALMGVGGVLAGGCTVGAGLSGVSTGSLAAIIALTSIALGGCLANAALSTNRSTPATA